MRNKKRLVILVDSGMIREEVGGFGLKGERVNLVWLIMSLLILVRWLVVDLLLLVELVNDGFFYGLGVWYLWQLVIIILIALMALTLFIIFILNIYYYFLFILTQIWLDF